MHARTDAAAEKLLVQNVPCTTLKSTQGGGTTTVLSNDPRSILKMAWFGLPNPDMEPIPRDMPLPEFNPMHNPPPVGPKAGWTYPVIVHLDILEDL